jgi:putative endonuclease
MWFVYILRCSDGHLYTGCTGNIDRRLKQHDSGEVFSTHRRRPITLITYTVFFDKHKAFEFEKYLKSGSGRAFVNRHLL